MAALSVRQLERTKVRERERENETVAFTCFVFFQIELKFDSEGASRRKFAKRENSSTATNRWVSPGKSQ